MKKSLRLASSQHTTRRCRVWSTSSWLRSLQEQITGRFWSGENCSFRLLPNLHHRPKDPLTGFCRRSPFDTCASRVLQEGFLTSRSHALSQILPCFMQARLKKIEKQKRSYVHCWEQCNFFTNVTKRGKKCSSPNRRLLLSFFWSRPGATEETKVSLGLKNLKTSFTGKTKKLIIQLDSPSVDPTLLMFHKGSLRILQRFSADTLVVLQKYYKGSLGVPQIFPKGSSKILPA